MWLKQCHGKHTTYQHGVPNGGGMVSYHPQVPQVTTGCPGRLLKDFPVALGFYGMVVVAAQKLQL